MACLTERQIRAIGSITSTLMSIPAVLFSDLADDNIILTCTTDKEYSHLDRCVTCQNSVLVSANTAFTRREEDEKLDVRLQASWAE